MVASVRSVGSPAGGTGSITVNPGTHESGDIQLLIIESASSVSVLNNDFIILFSRSESSNSTYLTVGIRKCTSSSMGSTIVDDTGDHTYGLIVTIKDCIDYGNFLCSYGSSLKGTASTSTNAPSVTTDKNNCLILNIISRDNDSSSSAFSNWVNSNLKNLTEIFDSGTTAGNGGGIGIATGELEYAGDTGTTTASVTSSKNVSVTIAFYSYVETNITEWFYPNSAENIDGIWDLPWSNINNILTDNNVATTNYITDASSLMYKASDRILLSYSAFNISNKIVGVEFQIKAKASVNDRLRGAHDAIGLIGTPSPFLLIYNNETLLHTLGFSYTNRSDGTNINDTIYNPDAFKYFTTSYVDYYLSKNINDITNELINSTNFKVSIGCSNISTSSAAISSIDTVRVRFRTEKQTWIPKIIMM